MNKTKKYTIIFIIVCFVFIGGMGIWNTHFPSQPKEEITHQETVSNEINSQKEETQQDKTQTSNDTTKQEQTQKKTQSQTQKETTPTF